MRESELDEPVVGGISTNEVEKVGPNEVLLSLSDPRRRRTVWKENGHKVGGRHGTVVAFALCNPTAMGSTLGVSKIFLEFLDVVEVY